MTGLENLAAGASAIVDHANVPQTKEHVYAIAQAYEALGIRAWVLVDATDLPRMAYTREAYPKYPKAVATADLPEAMRPFVALPRPFDEQLATVREIITGWKGTRVKLGLAFGSPTWCTDGMLAAGAALARELDVPIAVHAEESTVQREVCLAQWGMSGIRRLEEFGVLSSQTIVAHTVQIDDEDIKILARTGASVAHNPLSNLKLQNGVAPVGKLLAAGVNVCLGSDGASSGDDQSLFPVMRVVAALAHLNGLRADSGVVEEAVIKLATANGKRLWWDGDPAADRMELASPVAAYAPVWSDLAPLIAEVRIDGEPALAKARELVRARGAARRVAELTAEAATADASDRGESFAAVIARLTKTD